MEDDSKVVGEAKAGTIITVYIRPEDKLRLAKIAEVNKRSMVDQLSVIIDRYEAGR